MEHCALLSDNLLLASSVALHLYALFGTTNPFTQDLSVNDACSTYLILMLVGAGSAVIAILGKLYLYMYGCHNMVKRLCRLAILVVLYTQAAATWQSEQVGECGGKMFNKGTFVLWAGILSVAYVMVHSPRRIPDLLGARHNGQRSRW